MKHAIPFAVLLWVMGATAGSDESCTRPNGDRCLTDVQPTFMGFAIEDVDDEYRRKTWSLFKMGGPRQLVPCRLLMFDLDNDDDVDLRDFAELQNRWSDKQEA